MFQFRLECNAIIQIKLTTLFSCIDNLSISIFKPKHSFRFSQVTYLEPGQSSEIEASGDSKVRVQATAGPVLGPPWQRPENGYNFFQLK